MTDSLQPWQRQLNESARAYRAFCIYRDMGADRSLVKVRQSLSKKSGYDRQIAEWSSRHHWVERVAAYDKHIDDIEAIAFEQTLAKRRLLILEKEVEHADALLAKFDQVLQRVEVHQKTKTANRKNGDQEVEIIFVEINIEDLHELTKWRRDLAEFARLTVGMPGRIAQGQHTGKDGGPLKVEWVEPLDEDDEIGIGADELPETD